MPAEPEFWAAHLVEMYEGSQVESFGVDPADVEGMLERLSDKAAWPMFRVPLMGGHSVVAHYNNARLLLLLPVLGDTNIPAEAVTLVQEALTAQGTPDDGEALARRLLQGHPMWGAAPWSFDEDERAWICAGEHSPRKEPLGDHLPDAQRRALDACLTPFGG
ncbi:MULTISPECIES: hypothetical protein [unclassified Streptomyces]|uniref:hypothetical protein n=1 Tax=unclassified Streptomyces TaxID=2593676 RepID=UPI00225209E4|nr:MULTISPECIES: hypothetical protein [unclassified Streptomyces]MCX4527216.1 hypothetical protein [Streptomyces sp. NBC_01551]MCX4542207.1 hypothetical protein [Streptomyces sp. NBC_01565]